MSNRAWVTLATNDSYGLGALVLANSLRRVGSEYPAVVLITPSVTDAMRERLNAVFSEVVIVDVLDSRDAAHLALLQRPELGITFTKIHCWSLTQFEKGVFLDADTLVVQNCDELFEREELSAAPDVGWPDCFNSGVFVFKPSAETFERLIAFAQERGSFDGGDQGLLNSFFSDWARGDISKHLPFLYNVTSAAFYSYLPALKHFGQDLKIIHFIGAAKPWLQHFNFESRTVDAPDHIRGLLQMWWDIFVDQVHSQLDAKMVDVEEPPETPPPELPPQDVSQHYHYQPVIDPESEFPWHRPEAQAPDEYPERNVEVTDIHDPWEFHRGNIPPMSEQHSQAVDNREEIRQYVWEYQHQDIARQEHRISESLIPPLTHTPHSYQHSEHQHSEPHTYNAQHEHNEPSSSHLDQPSHLGNWHHDTSDHFHQDDNHHHEQHYENTQHQTFHTQYQEQSSQHNDNSKEYHDDSFSYQPQSIDRFDSPITKDTYQQIDTLQFQKHEVPIQNNVEVCRVHVQDTKKRRPRRHKIDLGAELQTEGLMNGDISESESDFFEELIPRHPYDGFYLRHRAIIDSRGRKVCTHEIPPTPSPTPSPSESPTPQDYDTAEETLPSDTEDNSGVAGNLARVVAGGPHEALDDLTRRQGWEAGNIDYMGADSFDKIWAKISQTLTQPRSSPSPPKESPPPPAQEILEQAGEVVKEEVSEAVEVAKEAVLADAPALVTPAVPKPDPVSEPTPVPVQEPAPVATPVEEPVPVTPTPVATPVEEPVPATPTPVATPVEEPVPATPTPIATPVEEPVPATPTPVATPVEEPVPTPVELPKVTEAPAETPAPVAPAKVDTPIALEPAALDDIPVTVALEVDEPKKTESVEAPKPEQSTPEAPVTAVETPKATPEKTIFPACPVATDCITPTTDSPPLATTPSKEEAPAVPAAKSEERRKVGKLQLSPPATADPLPTPDSEAEDAAALAHAIIASELRQVQTPTVTSPLSPAAPASPPSAPKAGLTVEEPQVPTPPVGAVSLAQIGVKPKEKTSTAAQLESSIAAATEKPDAPKDAPKKKIIKKVVKKDKEAVAAGADAPVPPPRKKEKKPKEK